MLQPSAEIRQYRFFPVVCGSHHDVSAFCLLCLCTLLYVYTECVVGWFGADCQQQCECENGGQCDRQTGRCSCSAGWVGELCERGEAASLYLHNNLQTLWPHAALWKLLDCVFLLIITSNLHLLCSACEPGLFGAGCEERCQCVHGASCHHVTGQCQCPAGWRGKLCDKGMNLQSQTLWSSGSTLWRKFGLKKTFIVWIKHFDLLLRRFILHHV